MAVSRTVRDAVVATSGAAHNEIVAAPATGKRIMVTSIVVVADNSVDLVWRSGSTTGGTNKSGSMALTMNSGYVAPHNGEGWFACDGGESLTIKPGSAVGINGHITYKIIDV